MKEIFDWLREQTTNVWKLKENPYDSYWNRAMYLEIKKENDKKEDAMIKMQEIIDEAEAKWKEDCCEWKLEDEEANLYVTKCEQRQLIFEGTPTDNGYMFCPYCGKRIKISEVE